jgi:hypothetical protein
MATRKGGGADEPRGGGQRARRGRPGRETLDAPGAPEVPAGADRARDMVMVDPWGALLEGLMEPPEEDGEEPTGVRSTPGKGAAHKR